MKYNLLGNTGLRVSELCLGTMTFGGKGMWTAIGTLGQEHVDELVKRAFDGGINFIDTANVYSEGLSEELTGKAIKNLGLRRDDLVLATKVRGKMGEGPNDSGLTRKHILSQVEGSLKRLQTDYIDLYQIHGFDALTPLEETVDVLDSLIQSGKVRYIGCSNLAAWQLMKAISYSHYNRKSKFVSLQAYYTIAGRDLESEQGSRRTSFDFPPVNKEKAYDIVEVLEVMAKEKDSSVARLALAWLLYQKVVTTVIIGAKRPDQLDDNLKSIDVRFSAEELQKLDEISKLTAEYPGWMLERQGADRKVP